MSLRLVLAILLVMLCSGTYAAEIVKPLIMDAGEIQGSIFQRPSMIKDQDGDKTTLDVVSMLSSDKKFVSGMYQAGPSYFETDDSGYGVDEFMYFLKGSVKLTSADGSVQYIKAGDAVTIPKEWTGIWETDGYTKIYVIYSLKGDLE